MRRLVIDDPEPPAGEVLDMAAVERAAERIRNGDLAPQLNARPAPPPAETYIEPGPDPRDDLADAYREHAAARRASDARALTREERAIVDASVAVWERTRMWTSERIAAEPPPPTCASCRHWDASEPPHPTRRDPSEVRRRCGLLSSAQDDDAGPVLLVPLSIAGPRSVAAYTPPGWHCDGWKERETPAAGEGGGKKK